MENHLHTNPQQRNKEREESANSKLDFDSRNFKFFKEDIFNVPFTNLGDSSNYKHLKHVFVDEDDYEDFKQDLLDFHRLRSRWKDDRKKVSQRRGSRFHSDAESTLELPPDQRKKLETSKRVEIHPCSTSELDSSSDDSMPNSPSMLRERKNTSPYGSLTDLLEGIGRPQIMDFFQNDEHFKEFDRVFETVKQKKRYASNSSLEKYRLSPSVEDGNCDFNGADYDDDAFEVDAIFADFFDNDTDFQNFEDEFQKFQVKRHSQSLEKLRRTSSVIDLIGDLKAFCDTEKTENKSSNSELPKECELPSGNQISPPRPWNAGGEWDYIFNKVRRRGTLTSESSGTGRSDLTVICDEQSGNNLLNDLIDSNCDTGYYSEVQYNGDICSNNCNNDCQYTCHHKCLPQITLDCKSVSHEETDEGAVLLGDTSLSSDLSTSAALHAEFASEPATEKDETDSGYRSGTIPDEKLPRKPSQATLNREELKKRIAEFNKVSPGANFALREDESDTEAFQGFIKVTLNLVRPIQMSLGARPPSIYEVLTREHIVEQNTQNISFYMPRDTVRSIHSTSSLKTKDVIAALLKKFHILDHPRKFALYEQELRNNKIAKLRRVKDEELPLKICLDWELENVQNHRLVLQENETGEIDWNAFCVPELNNFIRVLDREEQEHLTQLQYKYKVMRRVILQRMKEIRLETEKKKRQSIVNESTS